MKKIVGLAAALSLALLAGSAAARSDYNPHYYYGEDCREQNATAGTVLGAVIGGILGSQVHGSGRGAATVAGVILGGVAGNAIGRDIDCRDRPYAFHAYSEGFDGPVGRRYDWHNPRRTSYGYFRPEREYREHGVICRDFSEERYARGRRHVRRGTACRESDGNWHFR